MRSRSMAGSSGPDSRSQAPCGRCIWLSAEAARQVLRDNHDQVLLLSLEQIRSRTQTGVFREHLTAIEQRGLLRRDEEALPTPEALAERHTRFAGLTDAERTAVLPWVMDRLIRADGIQATGHLRS